MGAFSRKFSSHLSRQSPGGLLILLMLGVFPLASGNMLYVEILMLAALYAIFAMSWDILTGYTHEVNFGFAFFIGGAGYLSGALNTLFSWPPLVAIPLAASVAASTCSHLYGIK